MIKKIEREKRTQIKAVYPGDLQVFAYLTKQKPMKQEVQIHKSQFVHALYIEGKYILFHTLTRQILVIAPELIEWFIGNRTFSPEVLRDEAAAFFWENWFLVPEDRDEYKTWQEIRQILMLKQEIPEGIVHYVILPTSVCNARCFYCYEQGMPQRMMSPETVEATIRFILDHRPKQGKIHIHWFGGEPTMAPEIMDRLCAGLEGAGVDFFAEMTSNGSRFTPEMATHARDTWKTERVQITLDGLAEEYVSRKKYLPGVEKPFETVTGNIRNLIAAGIYVTIRLNVDENNVGDAFRTADFIRDFYSEEERRFITVYAHSIFETCGNRKPECQTGEEMDVLEETVQQINEYLIRQGLMKKNLQELSHLKTCFCLAAAQEYNVVIDSKGKLYSCEAMTENTHCGDVYSGMDSVCQERRGELPEMDSQCRTCTFLPQCTDFNGCPNRLPFDLCRRQEKRKLDSDLRLVYYLCREKQAKETAEH